MTDNPQAELDALRQLIQEALSQTPDMDVSMGALMLRKKFSVAAMERLDTDPGPSKEEGES